jgi:hypothetical protein
MEQLLAESDLAMNEAKNSGRNRLVVHRESAGPADSSTVDLRVRQFGAACHRTAGRDAHAQEPSTRGDSQTGSEHLLADRPS